MEILDDRTKDNETKDNETKDNKMKNNEMKDNEMKEIQIIGKEKNEKEMDVEEKHQGLVKKLMIFNNNIFICNKETNNGR